ncbi:Uncharacterised protein [Mycobacteroides abscessus subsp. abscessus]|nr:Uncharacterised protein [Mycobacteroides abscessus subsp. abscessus]
MSSARSGLVPDSVTCASGSSDSGVSRARGLTDIAAAKAVNWSTLTPRRPFSISVIPLLDIGTPCAATESARTRVVV